MNKLPCIGITMGDPSGIGPEIIVKVLSQKEIFSICRPIILGDPGAFDDFLIDFKDITLNSIERVSEARGKQGEMDIIPISRLNKEHMLPGRPTIEGGRAMVAYIKKAVELALRKELAAIITCPISKSLMQEAGYPFEGHTQYIAHLTDTDDYVMMLAGERLRVTLVTIHCAIRDVPDLLDVDNILKVIRTTARGLRRDFGIRDPRIAVAALNPHAGESGIFGTEEVEIIKPAVEKAIKEGYNVSGPHPADTIYFKAASGSFDVVVNMYHDQGLIPLKLLHFSDGVNITLGLPIVRTSVDHGTAYDIAGKGLADPSSLKAAIETALFMAKNRKEFGK